MIKSPFTKLAFLLAFSLLNSSLAAAMIAPFSSLGGNIQIGGKKQSDADLAKKGINRDLNHTQIITKDQQTGGLDATVTVDHRLASEKGRNSIREDVLKSGMFIDAAKQVVTTDKVGIFDFNAQLGKQHNTYEGIKAKLKDNPKLAQQLNDPNLSPEQKQKIFNRLANSVMKKMGYKNTNVKLVDTSEKGQTGGEVRGHYGEDNNIHVNDRNNHSTKDSLTTLGHELAHAQDDQEGTFKPGDKDQNTYANNYGSDFSGYAGFINTTFNNQGLANSNNRKGNQDSSLIKNNNQAYNKLDKSKGDDLSIFVHGTFSSPKNVDKEFVNKLEHTFGEKVVLFDWSGDGGEKGGADDKADNSISARERAGERLSKLVEKHNFEDGEPLNMVGHSHGGNVLKEFTKKYKGKKKIDSLYFLATPHRGSHKLNSSSLDDNSIKANIYDTSDAVQLFGQGFDSASKDLNGFKHIKVEVDNESYIPIWTPLVGDHSDMDNGSTWDEVQEKLND